MNTRHGRRIATGICVLVCALGFGVAPTATASASAGTRPDAIVFPEPGSRTASPTTSISVRGLPEASIGALSVTGSVSGAHAGRWTAHSDHNGGSFHPAAPFVAGETVTVHTSLAIEPTGADRYTFTIEHPSSVTKTPYVDDEGFAPTNGVSASGVAPTTATYASRPDLHPPIMSATGSGPVADGLIALTPNGGTQTGPMLIDNNGAPVYFKPVPGTNVVTTDAAVQHYLGHPVLTWWQGILSGVTGHGDGVWEVLDTSYHEIAALKMDGDFPTDLHDMQITPQNTAIVISYNPVSMNLTSYGGPANGTVLELAMQEIDIPTGDKLFEWHSLDHIPLTQSHVAVPTTPDDAWDYIHGNAVAIDTDNNILLSGRHTFGVYKINRTTGALMWSLGKDLDFTAQGFSDWFAYQHDIRRRSDGTLSVFDNADFQNRPSRGLVMNVDETNHTVSIDHTVSASSAPNTSISQGSFRELTNGDDLVGWGNIGRLTEFNGAQAIVRDMTFPAGVQSYRAQKSEWHATPTAPPDAAIDHVNSSVDVKVSWNGATEVTKWVVFAGLDANHLVSIYARGRTGFETELKVLTQYPVIAVEARDKDDHPLGRTVPTSGNVDHTSYWTARANGAVQRFGTAANMPGPIVPAGKQIVGMATVPNGYLLASADGGVYAYGAARNLGSLAGKKLRAPILGIAARYDGLGYWLVGADGGVFAFGNAHFYGSMGGKHLNSLITGIASMPDGRGYWLVAGDGGIFAFGRAGYYGSTGSLKLKQPIVGMSPRTSDGKGYWLVARDGGIFSFGSAPFKGSTGALRLRSPIVGMASTNEGTGYWLLGADGGVFTFGDARFHGSAPTGGTPSVAMAHN